MLFSFAGFKPEDDLIPHYLQSIPLYNILLRNTLAPSDTKSCKVKAPDTSLWIPAKKNLMCTVTFIPLEKGVILTSNRDEHVSRGIALYPEIYQTNNRKTIFPKDIKAGGTWFISNENGDIGVLLNGAFEKHLPLPPYRKSRGLMLLDFFDADSPYERLQQYNFFGIENFTLILWHRGVLREIKWDGAKLKEKEHNPELPHIWSSVTLYSEKMINERHGWFENWILSREKTTPQDIFDFHFNTQKQNIEYGLRISRNTKIFTTSITSLCLDEQRATFRHYDLIQDIESVLDYDLKQVQYLVIPTTKGNEFVQKN